MDVEVPDTFPVLQQNETCDVTVIGGGISGLTTAYLLAREGKKVVLIEDGRIASGESGRTTAHLVSGLDDRYFVIGKLNKKKRGFPHLFCLNCIFISLAEKNHGIIGAKTAAQSHSKAIDLIEEIVHKENINCDFSRLDGYLFLTSEDSIETLLKEKDAATRAGLKPYLMNSVPFADVIGRNFGPALQFPNQGQFHPLKYLRGLADVCARRGVKIFTNTHAKAVKGGPAAAVTTANGFTISTQSIVVATNVPINDRVTIFTKVEPHRTYVIAAKVPKGKLPRGLYWDSGNPYH
jgi:glycine/D-amino acid oxidase-like deaminating enzyme